MILCKCGCGREVIRDSSSLRRVWHPACADKAKAFHEAKRVNPSKKQGTMRPPPIARAKMCLVCNNLSHARPYTGCPKCGLPYDDY